VTVLQAAQLSKVGGYRPVEIALRDLALSGTEAVFQNVFVAVLLLGGTASMRSAALPWGLTMVSAVGLFWMRHPGGAVPAMPRSGW